MVTCRSSRGRRMSPYPIPPGAVPHLNLAVSAARGFDRTLGLVAGNAALGHLCRSRGGERTRTRHTLQTSMLGRARVVNPCVQTAKEPAPTADGVPPQEPLVSPLLSPPTRLSSAAFWSEPSSTSKGSDFRRFAAAFFCSCCRKADVAG